MADKKISQLTPATTPLAGTEELPIVQGGNTVKVSVNNLTAGKAVTASQLTVANNSSNDAVRITQTGAGNALVVEDDTSPDASPFVVKASGNVGIGTTAPSGTLDVVRSAADSVINVTSGSNTLQIFENTAGDAYLTNYTSGKSIRLSQVGAGFINFGVNGSERMRIDSAGNVGIGTSAPGGKLDVHQATNASVLARVVNADAGASADARLLVSNGTTQSGMIMRGTGHASANQFVLFQSSATEPMTFLTNGSERLRIDSSGNVGIGTNAPNAAARLDVSSTTSGFLPPRMTTAQRDLIATPPNGLMLYNSTTDKLQVRAAGVWVDLH